MAQKQESGLKQWLNWMFSKKTVGQAPGMQSSKDKLGYGKTSGAGGSQSDKEQAIDELNKELGQ